MKKLEIKKTDPKNYEVYTFLLIVIGYFATKIGGIIGILGSIMIIIGIIHFFIWIRYKFSKHA